MLQYHFNWKTLSAMAGVTWWNFYFRLFPGAIRSKQVVQFLEHLLRHLDCKLLVVWDGASTHRSRLVWDFCARTTRTPMARISSRLRPRIKSRRVSLVPLETARTAQLLSADLRATEPPCPPSPTPHAQTHHLSNCFLGASRTLLMSLYYTKINKRAKSGLGPPACVRRGKGREGANQLSTNPGSGARETGWFQDDPARRNSRDAYQDQP